MNESLPTGDGALSGVDDGPWRRTGGSGVHLSTPRAQCPCPCPIAPPSGPRCPNASDLTRDEGLGTAARVSNTRVRIQSSQQRKHQNQSISGTSHRSWLPGSPGSQTFQSEIVRSENRRSMKDMLLVSSRESGHVCEDKSHS